MQTPLTQLILSWTIILMQIMLMGLMIRRQLRAAFPMFFTFLGVGCVATLLTITAYRFAYSQYFYIYWSLSTILMSVGLAVLYESFGNILKPFSAVRDFGKMLFWWAGLFLLVAAILTAAVTGGPGSKKIVVVVDLCDRCVHLMQCGLLMLLVFFQKRLNLSWRSPGMFVALGIGLSAALDLTLSYGEARFPSMGNQLNTSFNLCYAAILAMWAFRLLKLKPAPTSADSQSRRLVLQRWNEALVSYGYGEAAVASGSVESFLPGIEKTVDRVLARKIAN